MFSYREVTPHSHQTCGNCRHWDEEHIVEVPMYKSRDVDSVLAPCKRFVSDEDMERRSGRYPDRIFTDENTNCPDWCWMPSRQYLETYPNCKKALAELCREAA